MKREYEFFNPMNGQQITKEVYDDMAIYIKLLFAETSEQEKQIAREFFNIPSDFMRCDIYKSNENRKIKPIIAKNGKPIQYDGTIVEFSR